MGMECVPILASAAVSGAGVKHLLIIAGISLLAALVDMAMLEMRGVRMENSAVNGVGAEEQAQPTATSDSEDKEEMR